ncbi:ubiquinone anaerobic biosynthesis accessory factor UbiT [Bosea robiniae]|uniref:Predicted lipid carrier protein YhbT, contains SCP2 domain n=1 Tax=Bosea robiniae TaxID=1036780 RepID=A0ABY0PA30_9HYPH|nr:SCP2 sterol-binding domain-containing protein [Bosea robiniae]SDH80702.1 Predicted lipid carrier protein YhbT, contains SCP2 domain [Bosea robiniae]
MPESETTGLRVMPPRLPSWLSRAVAPLPLAPLQPALALMLARISRAHPDLYDRLGNHAEKRFGIGPTDLPFAFVLEPRPSRPLARAVRSLPGGLDASIRGPLAGLIGMAEGTLDGDALFFSRVLWVEGDVAAALALRNAIDDARIDFGKLLLGGFGPLGVRFADAVRQRIRTLPAAGGTSWS